MSFNVFEGARRIAVLAAFAWSAGWLAYGCLSEPDPAMRLSVWGPGSAPARAGSCGPSDASRWISAKLPDGDTVRTELCFTAHKSDDGRMLVPYEIRSVHIELPGKVVKEVPAHLTRGQLLERLKSDGYDITRLTGMLSKPQNEPFSEFTTGGKWQMGEAYSTEVRSYIDGVAERLVIPPDIAKDVPRLQWRARMLRLWEAAQALFGGLVAGWILVAAVGWVVRGFLGIRRGSDHKPSNSADVRSGTHQSTSA